MVKLIRSCKLRAYYRLNSKLYLNKDHAETRLSIYSIDSWISIDILSVTSRTKEPWNKSDKSLFLVIISYNARLRLAIYEMNTQNSDLSYTYSIVLLFSRWRYFQYHTGHGVYVSYYTPDSVLYRILPLLIYARFDIATVQFFIQYFPNPVHF